MHNAMRQSVGITPSNASNVYSTNTMSTGSTSLGMSSGGQKRSHRACDMCYRKKTKCEVEVARTSCVQCLRRKTKCVFKSPLQSQQPLQPQPQLQQNHYPPPEPEGNESYDESQSNDEYDQYVDSLKTRLARVESLLTAAGILHEDDLSQDGFSDDEFEDTSESQWEIQRQKDSSRQISQLSDSPNNFEAAQFPGGDDVEVTTMFKSHESDDSRYFGRCCSLSILSRDGIEWIRSKTGDVSFLSILSPDSTHDNPWDSWRPDVFHDLFASQVYKPLPPRSEVFLLIKDFFRTANRLFPIFHEASFMKMVEWQYTQQTCDDAARWATINIVICLAYEYRFSNSLKPEKDREKARLYFKNAISVFTDLALRRTDLLSVQALIGMGFFLRGNSGTQSALPFMTAAMRSCQRMGLHRNIARPDLSPIQQEQRRRVFWVAFTIDQSTCLRAGNAPSQHPDDFDVPLPQETEEDRDSDVSSNIPFFRQLCRMSLIKSRIYCRLYSAKSLVKPAHEIYQTVKELHAELEEWRKDYPFSEIPKLKVAESDFLFGFASVGLHFVYYNALIMIHRIPLLLNYLIMARKEESEELKSLSKAKASKSALICVTAARDTLKMVNNMPWGDIAWLWSLLYYVFLSTATIFSNILREPRNPTVREDLQSLNMAATFFATLMSADGPADYAGFMARMSSTLERIARVAVDRDEKRARSADEEDDEVQPPGSKRHSSRVHSSRPKMRLRRLSTSRSSMASMPPRQHQSTAPSTDRNESTATRSNTIDPSIPEAMEGFPPVNSSGYVVPVSPDDTTSFNPSTLQFTNQQQPTNPTGLGLTNLNGADINALMTNFISSNTFPSWPHTQTEDHTAQTASPLNTQSPYSATSGPTPGAFPDSWQVPLTADWQFGDDLWAGLFRAESLGTSQQVPSLPILNAQSFLNRPVDSEADGAVNNTDSSGVSNANYGNGYMGFGTQTLGYNFMPPSQEQSEEGQDGDVSQTIFNNAFMGMF